ncbi:hypothetical protein PR048_006941 [Dryococelus australis]|uniref:Uncharacterized protein n=1 Tax=Dryococelus australis TaxID=614101 RepID=A0ABQ9IDB6_9NEOP|nr:hypothetical protein PR048_006941 [Dryococelus australis]
MELLLSIVTNFTGRMLLSAPVKIYAGRSSDFFLRLISKVLTLSCTAFNEMFKKAKVPAVLLSDILDRINPKETARCRKHQILPYLCSPMPRSLLPPFPSATLTPLLNLPSKEGGCNVIARRIRCCLRKHPLPWTTNGSCAEGGEDHEPGRYLPTSPALHMSGSPLLILTLSDHLFSSLTRGVLHLPPQWRLFHRRKLAFVAWISNSTVTHIICRVKRGDGSAARWFSALRVRTTRRHNRPYHCASNWLDHSPPSSGSIPGGGGGSPPYLRMWNDAAGRRVFSGISRFPRPCIPALLRTRLVSPTSALETSNLGAAQLSSLAHSPLFVTTFTEVTDEQCISCASEGQRIGSRINFPMRGDITYAANGYETGGQGNATRVCRGRFVKAVHDKVSTLEINLRKKALPQPAYILTAALSDMHREKLVTMDGKHVAATFPRLSPFVFLPMATFRDVDPEAIFRITYLCTCPSCSRYCEFQHMFVMSVYYVRVDILQRSVTASMGTRYRSMPAGISRVVRPANSEHRYGLEWPHCRVNTDMGWNGRTAERTQIWVGMAAMQSEHRYGLEWPHCRVNTDMGWNGRTAERTQIWVGMAALQSEHRYGLEWPHCRVNTDMDHDGSTARLARRIDEALGVRVSDARIALSLLDLGRPVVTVEAGSGTSGGGLACASSPSVLVGGIRTHPPAPQGVNGNAWPCTDKCRVRRGSGAAVRAVHIQGLLNPRSLLDKGLRLGRARKEEMLNLYKSISRQQERSMSVIGHDRFCQERPTARSYRRKKKPAPRRAQSAAEFNPRTVASARQRVRIRSASTEDDEDCGYGAASRPAATAAAASAVPGERTPLLGNRLESLGKLFSCVSLAPGAARASVSYDATSLCPVVPSWFETRSEIGSKIDTENCCTIRVQGWTGDRDEIHWRFEISIGNQQPSTKIKVDPGSELRSLYLGLGKMLMQPGIRDVSVTTPPCPISVG